MPSISVDTVLEEYADRDLFLLFLLGLVATSSALVEVAGGVSRGPAEDTPSEQNAATRPEEQWPPDLLR